MSSAVAKQIAAEVGVTPRTIHRVLSGELKDTRPTIVKRNQRIRNLAAELGYRPNAAAKAISSQSFGSICLVIGRKPYVGTLPDILSAGIHDAAEAQHLRLLQSRVSDDELCDPQRVLRIVGEAFSDGMLVNYTDSAPTRFEELLSQYQIPAIWLNADRPRDCVRIDDIDAGRKATEFLLQRGHSRIAYFDGSHPAEGLAAGSEHYSAAERLVGYRHAMRDAGFRPVEYFTRTKVMGERTGVLPVSAVTGPDAATAVVSYADKGMSLAYEASRVAGRPAEIVAIVDQTSRAIDPEKPFATLQLPFRQLGAESVGMLLQKIKSPARTLPTRLVTCPEPEPAWVGGSFFSDSPI